METKKVRIVLCGLLALVSWAGLAAAGEAFVFNSANIDDVRIPGADTFVSLRFNLSEDVVVTVLGLYDYVGGTDPAGLLDTWNVSIWRCGAYNGSTKAFADMELVASATVGPVDGSVPTDNGCYYANVETPVLLARRRSGTSSGPGATAHQETR